jgi:phosphopantothenoylcysteine decarboxylase/phosphopantothenate--cysteine ligase
VARILITSGPTRQYLDAVRYLTNASSGRMGRALAEAAVALGHEVIVVSGPVVVTYPVSVTVHRVVSTEEMLEVCLREFPSCQGLIAAAAPCDYRPMHVHPDKIHKTGQALHVELVETADVVAALAKVREAQWMVGFALDTEDLRLRSLAKLEKKSCDLMVSNGPQAMDSRDNDVEIIDREGNVVGAFAGSKESVARGILDVIQRRLVQPRCAAR